MFVCIKNEGQRSLTPAWGQEGAAECACLFFGHFIRRKGHGDVRGRFHLRAEIKPRTCEPPTGRGAISLTFSDQDEAADAKHFRQILSQ